jgi:hypothetical protein
MRDIQESAMTESESLRAFLAAVLLVAAIPAAAHQNVWIGGLRCEVSSGLGLVVASANEMECIFTSASGFSEHYFGTIRKFGFDIGEAREGVLSWDVVAPTLGSRRGALAGDYVGAAASATLGVGVGAYALVGGLDGSITLQPLSVEVQNGLDLSAGVASLTLRPGRN